MTESQFNAILCERVSKIKATLSHKAKEYAKEDRLYNFKRSASILGITSEKALLGMFVKHLVSVLDLVEGTLPLTEEIIDEKIGDSVNYLILLEALLKEKL